MAKELIHTHVSFDLCGIFKYKLINPDLLFLSNNRKMPRDWACISRNYSHPGAERQHPLYMVPGLHRAPCIPTTHTGPLCIWRPLGAESSLLEGQKLTQT